MACDHTTKDCDCCAGQEATPALYNRPALSAINYRIGEYGHFLQRMLGKLHAPVLNDDGVEVSTPLEQLATREPDDHTIALIDAWAVASDVLTFYQERIANEGFLRTATERRSVLDLAAEIGYELSPGVAAETDLAFQVEEVTNQPQDTPITMPDRFVIPKGTQVQSMPQGSDELPQTFETLTEFEARPSWNGIRPLLGTDQDLTAAVSTIWLEGHGLNLKPGMRVLLVRDPASLLMIVRTVLEDDTNELKTTAVTFTTTIQWPAGAVAAAAQPFAANVASAFPTAGLFNATDLGIVLGGSWTGSQLHAIIEQNQWTELDILHWSTSFYTLPSEVEVYVFRDKVGVFGNNAPVYNDTLGKSAFPSDPAGGMVSRFSWDMPAWTIWKNILYNTWYHHADIYLERQMDKVEQGSYVALEALDGTPRAYQIGSAISRSKTGFGMSAKVTGLKLLDLEGNEVDNDTTDKPDDFTLRNTSIHITSEKMTLARQPVEGAVEADDELALDTLVLGLAVGQRIIVRGEQYDADNVIQAEARDIKAITHSNGRTTLTLDEPLAYTYKRDTVKVLANVVRASHGETVKQVLGSGDGASTHQRFKLSKAELTHVQAATTSGRASTLTVRVDGVAWTPVPSLYEKAATDRVYITRINDDAEATVQFGDGKMGARIPTGQVNVEAEYRAGIGLEGEVSANTLTLLKSKPYGVKSVLNPLAADGAEDPETLATARTNAPLTVSTLDRVVSLFDYEDLSAAFAGVGKAQAVALWTGREELVHVTVLDTESGEVPEDQLELLTLAIAENRDPNRNFICANGTKFTFSLTANVLIDPAYVWDDVATALQDALITAFSFDQRAFGQPVSQAEVIEVMHTVSGVTAVDIDALYIDGDAAVPTNVLGSRIATYRENASGTVTIAPAAILLINTAGITLNQMDHAT